MERCHFPHHHNNLSTSHLLCLQCASSAGVRVLIDAEQTWYQPAIHHFTLHYLMPQFNTSTSTPIYNTVQSYLQVLHTHCAQAHPTHLNTCTHTHSLHTATHTLITHAHIPSYMHTYTHAPALATHSHSLRINTHTLMFLILLLPKSAHHTLWLDTATAKLYNFKYALKLVSHITLMFSSDPKQTPLHTHIHTHTQPTHNTHSHNTLPSPHTSAHLHLCTHLHISTPIHTPPTSAGTRGIHGTGAS